MGIKEFSKELEKRTRKFAVQIIRLSVTLPNSPEAKVVRNQLTKCGNQEIKLNLSMRSAVNY